MGSIIIAVISFVCISLGILVGSMLRNRLPEHHLRDDSKEVIKVGTGFIATMTALVLGLLVSSAKSSFDAVNNGIMQSGAKVIALDRILAQYGPETKDIRQTLRGLVAGAIHRWWPEEKSVAPAEQPIDPQHATESMHDGIEKLSPKTDLQKWLHDQAIQTSGELAQGRWQLFEQIQSSLPTPFLVVLVSWLTILFACFSLLAPRNFTVVAVLLLCALSAAGAIFLIMEMCHPDTGLMKASCTPLLRALALLGK
jgi:hypothetical protein